MTQILGVGAALPKNKVTNDELSKTLETSDEWIRSRTGIGARHLVSEGEDAVSLSTEAAQKALDSAGINASDVDLVICATATPDLAFPSTACQVSAKLGIFGAPAFDLQAACSGFIYAMSVAESMIRNGQAKNALIIGVEIMSRIVDWQDRGTCVLFGDGAGAFVLSASDTNNIIDTKILADGSQPEILYAPSALNKKYDYSTLRMNGKVVFKEAVSKLGQVLVDTLAANNMTADDIDWVVPHQANIRIIQSMAEKIGLDQSKVVLTIEEHSNTSSASIPLAFDQAVRDGRIKRGHVCLLQAFGAGLTWGAAIVRF